MYWVISTGGEMIPNNPTEAMFGMLKQLISYIIFVYSLNIIGNSINDLNKQTNDSKMCMIERYIYSNNDQVI